jgi:hypothetical protein
MKHFLIEFTELDGKVSCRREVEGYSGMEIIGMLEIIKGEYLIKVLKTVAKNNVKKRK